MGYNYNDDENFKSQLQGFKGGPYSAKSLKKAGVPGMGSQGSRILIEGVKRGRVQSPQSLKMAGFSKEEVESIFG